MSNFPSDDVPVSYENGKSYSLSSIEFWNVLDGLQQFCHALHTVARPGRVPHNHLTSNGSSTSTLVQRQVL